MALLFFRPAVFQVSKMLLWTALLAALLAFSTSNVYASQDLDNAILEIKDDALRKCMQQSIQKNVTTSVQTVTNIKCHSKKIRSVEGLELFTALTNISLHNNKITQFNATNWPALETLNLAKNKLNIFDCKGLVKLSQLYLFSNNIAKLTLSNLPALEELKSSRNKIIAFNYNGLPNIEKIYLFDNKIKTMDIHNLPSMRYLDVRQNPMPDALYEDMDEIDNVTILHDGNAQDW